MRLLLKAIVLGLLASTLSIVALAGPAHAIRCEYSQTTHHGAVIAKFKNCVEWGGKRPGARVSDTYSSYEYYSRTGDEDITMAFALKDTRADGKCAWIRARKTDSPYPFDSFQPESACGKGTREVVGLEWRGINMAEGKLTIFVCTGRIKSDCKRLWTQRIK